MTDRAIKEERSLTAVNEPPSMLDSYVYLCIYTLAMLLTQRLSTYVRTYVSTYVQEPTIQSALLSLPRRPPSTGCFFVCDVHIDALHGAMTKRKRLRLFTLDDALARILSGSRLLNDLGTCSLRLMENFSRVWVLNEMYQFRIHVKYVYREWTILYLIKEWVVDEKRIVKEMNIK